MKEDITRYCHACDRCQRTKADKTRQHAPLRPNKIPTRPWQVISWDIISPLPQSNGYDAIFVVVDRFSKEGIVQECHTTLTAAGTAKIFLDRVFRHHGMPEEIICDRGTQFNAGFMKELLRLLGIKQNMSTAFHPQTDGQTERVNQEIEQYLRTYVNYHQDDWQEWLPIAEFSYNDKVNASTGFTPFYITTGQHPWKGTMKKLKTSNEKVEEFVKRMRKVREQAESALYKAADKMKKAYDKKKSVS